MNRKLQLAELQLAIMQVLWERGEATVAEVHEALQRDLAYTTVATMLTKMTGNGQVEIRRRDGRVIVYGPAIKEQAVSRALVSDLARKLVRDDVTNLVHHLLEAREASEEELTRLEELIRRHRSETSSE